MSTPLNDLTLGTNRYQQLISAIPKGAFYDTAGTVLPARDTPYQFQFAVGIPNRDFGVYVNAVFQGKVTSDGTGTAIVQLPPPGAPPDARLGPGRIDIILTDSVTQATYQAFATIVNYAVWLAAYADQLEGVAPGTPDLVTGDSAIDDLARAGILIASDIKGVDQVGPNYIEAVFGQMLRQPNNLWPSVEAFRLTLQELRQGYRDFGQLLHGLVNVTIAIAASRPFVIPRSWRPQWVLGESLLPGQNLNQRTRTSLTEFADAGLDLPTINAKSLTYVVPSFDSTTANLYSGAITQPPVAQRLTVTYPNGWAGGPITIYGVDIHDLPLGEVFAVPSGGGTVSGQIDFETITSIAKTTVAAGANPATIGLAESRFARVVGLNGSVPLAGITLDYNTSTKLIGLGGNFLSVGAPTAGTYTVPDQGRQGQLYGLPSSPYALGDGSGNARYERLYLSVRDRPTLPVTISAANYDAVTATEVKASIDAAIAAVSYPDLASETHAGSGFGDTVLAIRDSSYSVRTYPPTYPSQVNLLPGPADASALVFGYPRTRTTLTSGYAAGALSLALTSGSTFPPASAADVANPVVFGVRVGRGIRFSASVSYTLSSASHGTATASVTGVTPLAMDVGGAIRFDGGANAGLHRIIAAGVSTFTLLHEDNTTNFTAGTFTTTVTVYAAGELVEANTRTGNTLTIGYTGTGVSITKLPEQTLKVGGPLPPVVGRKVVITGAGVGANDGTFDIIRQPAEDELVYVNTAAVDEPFFPGTWRIGGLANAQVSGAPVELAGELPVSRPGVPGLAEATVVIDTTAGLEPTGGALSDPLAPVGTAVPDGWTITNATADVGEPGLFNPERLVLTRTAGGDIKLETNCPRAAEVPGLQVRVSFWASQHFVSSFVSFHVEIDFGQGALVGPTTLVEPTELNLAAPYEGSLSPTLVTSTFLVPWNASQAVIRLVSTGPGSAGDRISVDEARVFTVTSTGLGVGKNTVARSKHRDFFGELVYLWTPGGFTTPERTALGVPAPASPQLSVPATPTADGESYTAYQPGHIDNVVDAHGLYERYDVSEYLDVVKTVPTNLRGSYTDMDWLMSATTNLQLVPASPQKRSYLRPPRLSAQTDDLDIVSPSNATLSQTSDQNGATIPNGHSTMVEILGQPRVISQVIGTAVSLPVGSRVPFPSVGATIRDWSYGPSTAARGPADNQVTLTGDTTSDFLVGDVFTLKSGDFAGAQGRLTSIDSSAQVTLDTDMPSFSGEEWSVTRLAWYFTADNAVKIDPAYFDPTSTYELSYQVLMSATTGVIDLAENLPPGGLYTDYVWIVDGAVFRRYDAETLSSQVSAQALFRGDFTAVLAQGSDQDKTTSTLFADTGSTRTPVATSDWSYVDGKTILLNSSVFNPDAIYTLVYNAQYTLPAAPTTYVLDWRSGASPAAVNAAPFIPVKNEQVVATDQYHQLRIRVSNVVDARDIRVQGLGLRGIHLYGATPNAPGIIV